MTKSSQHCLFGLALSAALGSACGARSEENDLGRGVAMSGAPSEAPRGGADASHAGGAALPGGGAASAGGSGGNSGPAVEVAGDTAMGGDTATRPINVLILNYATTFGHQSRETAIPLLKAAGDANGINFDPKSALTLVQGEGKTDSSLGLKPDLSPFSDGLDAYDVVFFLNTTGDALSSDGASKEVAYKQALQDFLEKKHRGFVGTHSATDTFHSASLWQWYIDMIGAKFLSISNAGTLGSASVKQEHPILAQSDLPNPWTRGEEWYTFDRDPASMPGFTVLLVAHVDALTERPTAWVHDINGGGRVFYTAFGHDVSTFAEPTFMKFLVNGIKWAAHRL